MSIKWLISEGQIPYLASVESMENHVAALREGREEEMVWLLEHPAIYTAGTSATPEGLIDAQRFPVYRTGRGGDYTYHGPGQRVAYVMLDLKRRGGDVHEYVRNLEAWIINTLSRFNITGERRPGRVGIWVIDQKGDEMKIAALGVRVRQGVTYHGISVNLCPDLSHYAGIIPCGITEYGVTSIKELGINVTKEDLDEALKEEFLKIFE